MKGLTIFFGATVAVIVLSFVMTVVTAIEQRRAVENAPRTIPVPALGQ